MPHPREAPEPPHGQLRDQKEMLVRKIKNADIVVGEYPDGHHVLFYGEEWMQAIKETGQGVHLATAVLPVDPATDDIEFLIAVCRVVKGKCDYDDR